MLLTERTQLLDQRVDYGAVLGVERSRQANLLKFTEDKCQFGIRNLGEPLRVRLISRELEGANSLECERHNVLVATVLAGGTEQGNIDDRLLGNQLLLAA